MRYRQLLLIVCLGAAMAWPAFASADVSAADSYLGVQGTWVEPDDSRLTDEGWGGTLRLGTQFSDHIDLELVGSGIIFNRDSSVLQHDFLYTFGGDALWVFNRGGFSPHLAFGGGMSYDDTVVDHGFGGYVDAGFGFRYPLMENGVQLRFDARYVEDFNSNAWPDEDNFGDIRVSLGVQVPLGYAAATPVPPMDHDGDGVPPNRDQCPNTPTNVRVGINGCALDEDNDGVPDFKDQCPATPVGTPVNAMGCQLISDVDGDGVADQQDQCPGTPPGTPVLTNGCGTGQGVVLRGVTFKLSKATLTPSARRVLQRVAQELKDSPGFKLEIAGYTDSSGSSSLNRKLSQQRAASVKRYLQQRGVDPARLQARGFGESNPIGNNLTAEGRAMNRRVEMHVLERSR